MARIAEEHGNIIIELSEIDDDDAIVFRLNGKDIFAVDMMYSAEHAADDPNLYAPRMPHAVIGWWPDGENWERLAYVPLHAK
jgi:hypothetical protein